MTTVVLIPGLLSDGFVWRAVTSALPAAKVADVTTQDSIAQMARDILARHAGPLIVAGHSMGGRVAMEMARIAPDRILGLALLNTGLHPARPNEPAQRQVLIDLAQHQGMVALAAQWLPPMLAQGAPSADLVAMVCRMTPQIHARQIGALLTRPDAALTIGQFTGPMLLMTGAQDRWSPVAQHQSIAALCPQARFEIVENAGHFAPIEQPQAVAQILTDWLGQVIGADRIPETPLFDRARGLSGYALNKMAMGLSTPQGRAAFLDNESAYLDCFDLTPDQRRAVMARDWADMVRLGGNLFYLLKISAVDPTPIRAIGAAQAGMELQDFLDDRLGKVTHG